MFDKKWWYAEVLWWVYISFWRGKEVYGEAVWKVTVVIDGRGSSVREVVLFKCKVVFYV